VVGAEVVIICGREETWKSAGDIYPLTEPGSYIEAFRNEVLGSSAPKAHETLAQGGAERSARLDPGLRSIATPWLGSFVSVFVLRRSVRSNCHRVGLPAGIFSSICGQLKSAKQYKRNPKVTKQRSERSCRPRATRRMATKTSRLCAMTKPLADC